MVQVKTAVTWESHVERWRHCQACVLCTQRTNIVLARGSVPCDVLFVGEGPGQSEDVLGRPFVGPAGQLLDQIVEAALAGKWTWAMTNLVACFPAEAKAAKTNEPSRDEIEACSPRLREFVAIARPRLVVAVGKLADENLYLSMERGVWWGIIGEGPGSRRWITITHPAAVLRMPAVQQEMACRRCVVTISEALEELQGC